MAAKIRGIRSAHTSGNGRFNEVLFSAAIAVALEFMCRHWQVYAEATLVVPLIVAQTFAAR